MYELMCRFWAEICIFWGVGGFVFGSDIPKPKEGFTPPKACVILFLMGPFCWLIAVWLVFFDRPGNGDKS